MVTSGAIKTDVLSVNWSTKADSSDKSRQGYAIEVGGEVQSIKDDSLIGSYLGGSVVVQNSFQKSETNQVNETSLPKSTGFKGEAGFIVKPSEWLQFKPGLYLETGWTKQNLMADISNYWKGAEALKTYRGFGGSLSAETNLFGKKSDGTKRAWSFMLGLSTFLGKRTYGYILSPRDPHPGFNGIRGLGVGAGFTFGLKLHAQEQIDDDIIPPPPPPPPPPPFDTQTQDGIEYVPGATKFSKDQKVELTFNSQKTEPTKAVFEFVGTDAKKEITIQPGDGQTVVLLDSIATDPVRKQLGEEWNGQVKLTSLNDTALPTPIEFPLELVKVVEAPQGEVKYSGLVGSGTYKSEEDVKVNFQSSFTKAVPIVVDFGGGKTKLISISPGNQTVTLLSKDDQFRKDLGDWEGTPSITTVGGSKLSSAVNLGRVKLEKVEEAKEGLALSFRSGVINQDTVDAQGITADQLEDAVFDFSNYDKKTLSLKKCESLGYHDVKLRDGSVVNAKIVHMVIHYPIPVFPYRKQWIIAMLPPKRTGADTKIEWAIIPHKQNSDKTFSGPFADKLKEYPDYDYYDYDVGGWELNQGQLKYWVSFDTNGIDAVKKIAGNAIEKSTVLTNLQLMIEAAKKK